MGAFNVLTATRPYPCPGCGETSVRVQFKFGSTRQLEYRLGEVVTWGGNDIGRPGMGDVTVLGAPEACPKCGWEEDRLYAVDLRDDVLSAVRPLSPPESEPLLRQVEQRGW